MIIDLIVLHWEQALPLHVAALTHVPLSEASADACTHPHLPQIRCGRQWQRQVQQLLAIGYDVTNKAQNISDTLRLQQRRASCG